MDPLQCALESMLATAAGSSTGIGAAAASAAAPATVQRTIRAALRLQQMQREGQAPSGVLEATIGGLLQRLMPAADHAHEEHSESASASASADETAGVAVPAANLESLAVDVEVCWQLLVSIGEAAGESVVRDCGLTLFLLLRPQYRPLHATAVAHLAQANRPALQHLLLQLLDEFLLAHTPLTHQHVPMHPLLPPHLHRALAPAAVLQVASSALTQMAADPAATAHLQGLFELRLLPLYRLTAEAATLNRAPMDASAGAASGSDSPFSSLPALLHKHVLPLFLAPSFPLHHDNLRTMYSTVLSAIDTVARMGGSGKGGAKILPVLFAFLVDYFESLCALMAATSPADFTDFFNSLLLCAQLGLASTDTYLIKQSLSLLVSRARVLYTEEDAALHATTKRHQHKGNPRGQSNGARGSSTAAAASAASASAAPARVPRSTHFPDYTLRTWLAYENLFDILSAYELHLIKFSFNEQVAPVLLEHEEFYKHEQRRAGGGGGGGAAPAAQFTPDIFLELLFKYALTHANPYVRKYIYFMLLLQLKDRVRLSKEMLFLETTGGAGPSPLNASVLHVLSSCALQSLLPSKQAMLAFWQAQLDLLRSAQERQEFMQGLLHALARKQLSANQGNSNHHANLTLHLNFLAHARLPAGEIEGGELAVSASVLLPALHALIRTNAATTSSTQATLPRAALAEAIAWVYLRYTPHLGAGNSSDDVAHSLRELAHFLCTVVPQPMQRRSHPFHQRLSARLNENEVLSDALAQFTSRLSSGSIHAFSRSPLSIHTECAETLALFALLPPSHSGVSAFVQGVIHSVHHALMSAGPTPHALELMVGLLALVEEERHAPRAAAPPARGSFQSVMSSLNGAPQLQSPPPAAVGPVQSLLDSLLLEFLSSPSSCFSLLAFIRATLTTLPGAQEQQYGAFSGDQAHHGSGAAMTHVRGLCFALVGALLRLYPSVPAVRQMAQQLVADCLSLLLPTSESAGPSRPLPPLHECALVQVVCTVVQGAHLASKRGPLPQHAAPAAAANVNIYASNYSGMGMEAPNQPIALSDLLEPHHFLALLSFLCSTPLVSKLASKSLFAWESSSFAPGEVSSFHELPEQPEVLKANWFCNSQLTRWTLLQTVLQWSMEGWQKDGYEPMLLVAAAQAHVESQYRYDGSHAAPSVSSSSSSFAALLFQSSPSLFEGHIIPAVVDALDGSMTEYWPALVGCIGSCVSFLRRFQGAAHSILAHTDPARLGEDGQRLVLHWVQSHQSLYSSTLPPLFAHVWRSFQDVSCKKMANTACAASDSLEQLDWLGWSQLPRSEYETQPIATSADPTVPAIYSALVDLFLHPLLFAESESSHPGASSPRALLKSYLGLLLHLAQRKCMRALLYVLALRCVELWAAHPLTAVHYLQELAVLLTLDNKLETRHSGSGNSHSDGAAESGATDGGVAAVPMEHLIRVLFLSLLEHLTRQANSHAESAPVSSAGGGTSSSSAAYTFATHALHYLVSLNFHHAEFSMNRCGGDNPANEVERTMDELAEQEDAAGAGGAEAEGGRTARPAPLATVASSRVHAAISAIWHALCILSRLQLRQEHCRMEDAASMKRHRTRSATAAAAAAASAPSNSAKSKAAKGGSKSGASADPAPMPVPELLSPDFPLLAYVQSSVLVIFVSPALTSRIRHLLEIFLINFFTSNLNSPDPDDVADAHGGAAAAAAAAAGASASLRLEKALLPFLDRTVFRQNIICSFLVVTGYLCSYLAAEQFRLDQARLHAGMQPAPEGEEYRPLIHTLLSKLHVWSSSPLGQVRTVAQYFFYNLFLEVFHASLFDEQGRSVLPRGAAIHPGLSVCTSPLPQAMVLTTDPLPLSSVPDSTRSGSLFHVYYPVWLFLYRSTAVGAIRQRQDEYFRAFRPFVRGTVEGALRYGREFATLQRDAEAATAGEGGEQQEDGEAHEAAQLPPLPSPTADSSASAAAAPDNSTLLSYGTQLSMVDLLLHVRRVTSEHLHALNEEREGSYFDDSNANPLAQAAASSSASATSATATDPAASAVAPGVHSLNFQQKIAPVKAQFLEDAAQDAPSADASGGLADPSASAPSVRLASCKHLVVCASLVSKPVNLGGLCRTAEIMQATLLLGDARLLHDATFVGVSSTANLWADIQIVPKGDALVAHLLDMRARGYAIVGLEQTVHSTPLQRTRFPDRVVLVLGDEKRGIPASILNVLTHCVEIPQFGLIRSLNVHVSAGMLVWEYVKQALVEQEDAAAAAATTAAAGASNSLLRRP